MNEETVLTVTVKPKAGGKIDVSVLAYASLTPKQMEIVASSVLNYAVNNGADLEEILKGATVGPTRVSLVQV